ncbi:radical SAM protein [Halobellus ruber]|uniref:Radical SAM protein n=1 Tax=Halobellus ruber TaxID=2761102 RepID=A0A7J9SM26_9EURY|nr:radical SAM protein [Halobellus ruber]MBB6647057.1 radical SAM protein [Halobellus ruber]
MSQRATLAETTSLCPDCLQQVPGRYEERDGGVFLTRDCPDHGVASRRVWGSHDHWEWAAEFGPSPEYDGGDLAVDDDHACLAVVEVTDDCNLSCSYCFASSGPGGDHRSTDEIEALLDTVENAGGRPIQFSGGEPTVRDDLPDLVERARERGIDHVEVNTNGIRLATEEGYAGKLADAGVTAVYLQFDGLTSETYETIREVDLVEEKHAAIEACRDADLPVVLVPTVVPDVNDHEMGDIVRFALENRDVIRSVNFQPVAHFGRYATDDGRFAIDTATRLLAEQIGSLEPRDMLPAPCCSAYCQIGTAFVPADADPSVGDGCGSDGGAAADGADAGADCGCEDADAGAFVPLTKFVDDQLWEMLSGMVDEGDYMELLAGTAAGEEWACKTAGCCGVDVPGGVEGLFDEVVPVSFTGFMDADAADVNRLSNCCISVPTADGDLVPFCGYNMTTDDGEYALRNRNEWGGRAAVDDPRAATGADGSDPDADAPTGYEGDGVADGGRVEDSPRTDCDPDSGCCGDGR